MSNATSLPQRSEIEPQHRWRLEDIYPDNEAWEAEFKNTEAALNHVEAYRGHLGHSATELLAALQLRDQLSLQNERLYTYARMRRDEDNTQATYQALTDRAESLGARVQTAFSFFLPEILMIPEQTLAQFLEQEPGLKVYTFALEEIKRVEPHILSVKEEQILAGTIEVTQAAANIFRMLNNADLKFPSIKNAEGHEEAVSHGRFLKFMQSPDRRVRYDAFHALYGAYGQLLNTMAAALGASVKKDVFYARVRRYPSALEAALFADNVTPAVYENLIQTVREHLPLLHRYVKLRKKMLGLDDLHMYDLYVPLIPEVQWKIPYAEAQETVAKALAPLGKKYVKTMGQGMQSGWVDIYENRGKTSGAYSWGPYGVHPYVLLNYQDQLHDVFTLAHEMGHAMHSYYSYKTQPYVYAHYKIFTAEVASTVNESLVVQHLLQTTTAEERKISLLNHYLEQFRGTVFRQTMFAEFEKIIHAKVEAGEALTPAGLCQIYQALNHDYYGPDMVSDKEIALEWARIPHFYRAFYVYKYATGFSAATALAEQILTEGEPARSRYLSFLSAGNSAYPLRLLTQAGVDMRSPQPIQAALQFFARLLTDLETLAGQKT